MAKKNVEELTYKEASTELELIIRNLESGEMELDARRARPRARGRVPSHLSAPYELHDRYVLHADRRPAGG